MNERAIQIIENCLRPFIQQGRDLDRIVLYVSGRSQLSQVSTINTIYGPIRICSKDYIPKGLSYIMEDPGKFGRAFVWVARNK